MLSGRLSNGRIAQHGFGGLRIGKGVEKMNLNGYYLGRKVSSWHRFIEALAYVIIILGAVLGIGLLVIGAWLAYIWA